MALGWHAEKLQGIGLLLLVCTLLYVIPRTSVLGALLLAAYLGGATSTMVRVSEPFIFSVIMGILVWVGLYLRDENVRRFIPLKKI